MSHWSIVTCHESLQETVMRRLRSSCCSLLLVLAASCRAENIDLSTVPSRDTVQLTIYNSEDITLVRETRTVTFKKGVNPLQFTWANTLIDPTQRRAEVPDASRQAGRARHDVPARQAADAVLERAERDRRRSDDPDHLLHQRHHLDAPTTSRIADADEKADEASKASSASTTTAARNTRTPRCGWWSARSTWSRRSPSSRRSR